MSPLYFLNFISQDINHFLGFLFFLSSTYTFLYKLISSMWNRLMITITIHKNGYPPEHTDVNGKQRKVKINK